MARKRKTPADTVLPAPEHAQPLDGPTDAEARATIASLTGPAEAGEWAEAAYRIDDDDAVAFMIDPGAIKDMDWSQAGPVGEWPLVPGDGSAVVGYAIEDSTPIGDGLHRARITLKPPAPNPLDLVTAYLGNLVVPPDAAPVLDELRRRIEDREHERHPVMWTAWPDDITGTEAEMQLLRDAHASLAAALRAAEQESATAYLRNPLRDPTATLALYRAVHRCKVKIATWDGNTLRAANGEPLGTVFRTPNAWGSRYGRLDKPDDGTEAQCRAWLESGVRGDNWAIVDERGKK